MHEYLPGKGDPDEKRQTRHRPQTLHPLLLLSGILSGRRNEGKAAHCRKNPEPLTSAIRKYDHALFKGKRHFSPGNGMNLYRGCSREGIYCDSRSRCYQRLNGFEDIEIKENAIGLFPYFREFPKKTSARQISI